MSARAPERLASSHPSWPSTLAARVGAAAPAELHALGNLALLGLPKTALFCSARCPGEAILRAHDQAAKWRAEGRCIIGGFHSPVERDCLRVLLRGKSPVIVCPARGLPKRLPPEWKSPLASGQLLVLSCFPTKETRISTALARRRNEFVAALADEAWFPHIAPGGQSDRLSHRLTAWHVPFSTPEKP